MAVRSMGGHLHVKRHMVMFSSVVQQGCGLSTPVYVCRTSTPSLFFGLTSLSVPLTNLVYVVFLSHLSVGAP